MCNDNSEGAADRANGREALGRAGPEQYTNINIMDY